MHSDRLGSIGGIKGKVTAELFNAETKEREFFIEKDNMILRGFHRMVQQMLVGNYSQYAGDAFTGINCWGSSDWIIDATRLLSTLFISPDTSEVDENETMVKDILGFANRLSAYSGADIRRGTINQAESNIDYENHRMRFVFDFPTSSANGTFQSVGLYSGSPNYPYMGGAFMEKRRDLPYVERAALAAFIINFQYARCFKDRLGTIVGIPYASATKGVKLGVPNQTSVTQMGNVLKDEAGTNLLMICLATRGDKLIVLNNSNKFVVFNDSANIDGVNANTAYSIPQGTVPSIWSFAPIDDTTMAVYTKADTIDVVTGLKFDKAIYIINIATGVILQRIMRPISADIMGLDIGEEVAGMKYDEATGILKMVMSVPSTSYNRFIEEVYDVNDDGNEFKGFIGLNASGVRYTPLSFGVIDGKFVTIAWTSNSSNLMDYSTVVTATKVGFYEFVDDLYAHSRVLLPAPVTKLNTQTLKITYDITYDEGISA